MPATQTLAAYRTSTWQPTLTLMYRGGALPLAGAHIAMQVRLDPGAPDPALAAVPAIPFADALVSGTAGGPDELRALTLSPVLPQATLAALPGLGQPEPGDPQTYAYDIRITYADGATDIVALGDFIVSPGVTTI